MQGLPYHEDHTTFDVPASSKLNKKGYRDDIKALEGLTIWSGLDGARMLWDHQKQAIALCAAYSRVIHPLTLPEAGLIKMPTGTGKSGVVAVVSRCLPNIRKVLVLTPREGLVQQMLADIRRRFWCNMAVAPAEGKTWDGPGVDPATIDLLLPNADRTAKICAKAKTADRLILVGTLQALDRLRSDRDRLLRKAAAATLDADQQTELRRLNEAMDLLATFDLVLVDEGHYEPAPSWSRSVRSLRRPTLLLSATPFRNDYKLFSVRGAYAYNLPFQRAAESNIVRGIAFVELGAAAGSTPAIDAGEHDSDQPLTDRDSAAIATFAENLLIAARSLLAHKPRGSKIIVRGASWSALAALQLLLAGDAGEDAVLIHEQARDEQKRKAHPGRYATVKQAQAGSPNGIYWLHQTKLLEGIDDATFVAVALLDDFTNDRQLVQQIGRVLRSTDPTRVERQTATVFARNAENLSRLEASWAQYLSFEQAGEGHIDSIIPGEAYLPEKIIPHMPERQYVDGRFRERLPVTQLNHRDVVLPRRAAIFDVGVGFDDAVLTDEAYEGILARNRFVVQPLANCPTNVWGWTYFTVDESPYLARHFVTEWRFGLTLIVRARNRLFAFDTDGVPFEPKRVRAARLDRSDLVRLFAPSTASQQVRITKLAASSLDMSDRAIRTMTTSTASFEDTFTDLLDAVLLPTNVAGYVGAVPRYLGLTRSKLSEATVRRVSVDDYVAWVTAIDVELTSASASNRVFERFAQLTLPDINKAAEPRNILLDLQPLDDFGAFAAERESYARSIGAPALSDVCADIEDGKFTVSLVDGTPLDCTISYEKKSGRYAIASEALNASVESKLSRTGTVMTLTERINTDQSFRILTDETDKVYMQGKWVKAQDLVVDNRIPALDIAEVVPALSDTYLEKGEEAWAANDLPTWEKTSIFGLTSRYLNSATPGMDAYAKALQEFPLALLDDDGQEMADFILVSDEKVVLVHAKAAGSNRGNNGASVTAIQEVGRQVAASLGFFLTSSPRIDDDRWLRPYVANKTVIPSPPTRSVRVFRNLNAIPEANIAEKVRMALRDRRINKEVWLVAGCLLDIQVARSRALSGDLNNRTRQLIMYINSLSTTCGRGNARLRIFAN